MSAELGQTTNPKELVPGEPELISADLKALVTTIRQLGGVGDDLGRIDPVEWIGEASTAFREAFGAELPRWESALVTLGTGGQALADYADALTWGQREAMRAVELYTQAQAASRAALAAYTARARAAQANGQSPGPFADPGQAALEAAQAVLDNAREQLAVVGDEVARSFGFEPDGEGGYTRDLGGREFGAEGRASTWDPEKGEWVDEGGDGQQRRTGKYEGESGSQSDGLMTDLIGDTLEKLGIELPEKTWASAAAVSLAEGSLEGEFVKGAFSGNGKLEGAVLGAGAEAKAGLSALGLTAGASAEAYLAKGTAEGSAQWGEHAGVSGKAQGMVGAQAAAEGTVGWLGGKASGEAFVGARVEGDVSVEVAGLSAGAHGEAWAGAGVQASGQLGMGDDGKFHVGGSLGLGLGVGGKVGFEVAVDPGEVVDTVVDVADDVASVAKDVGTEIADTASDIGDGIGTAARGVGNALGL